MQNASREITAFFQRVEFRH